jgi:hypothetical protein
LSSVSGTATANAIIKYDTDTTPAVFGTYADFMARTRGSARRGWCSGSGRPIR